MQITENIKAPRQWPCEENSPMTGEFPAQKSSNAKNVSIWWCHHVNIASSCYTGTECRVMIHWSYLKSKQVDKMARLSSIGNCHWVPGGQSMKNVKIVKTDYVAARLATSIMGAEKGLKQKVTGSTLLCFLKLIYLFPACVICQLILGNEKYE